MTKKCNRDTVNRFVLFAKFVKIQVMKAERTNNLPQCVLRVE